MSKLGNTAVDATERKVVTPVKSDGEVDPEWAYVAACEAYGASLAAAGFSEPPEDNAAFEDAHSLAIGDAVDAAVKAERERVLAELADWLESNHEVHVSPDDEDIRVVEVANLEAFLERIKVGP